MASGQEYTLDAFGWNASQAPSDQRAAFQSALDSGEPLRMPAGENIVIDGTAEMTGQTSLIGAGCDIAGGSNPPSAIECVTSGVDPLKITGDNCTVRGLGIYGDSATGIVIGDGVALGRSTRNVTIDNVYTAPSLTTGVLLSAAANCHLENSPLFGDVSAVHIDSNINNDPLSADSGDNWITGCKLHGWQTGVGLRLNSGGGIYASGNKFLGGKNHVYMDWNFGGSGNLVLTNNSLETCDHISIDMRGEFPFKRAVIANNAIGGVLLGIAVRNFGSVDWLIDLNIQGNVIAATKANDNPVIDLGRTVNAYVTGNTVDGDGKASYGIITRNGTGFIGENAIVGCAQDVQNNAGWTTF